MQLDVNFLLATQARKREVKEESTDIENKTKKEMNGVFWSGNSIHRYQVSDDFYDKMSCQLFCIFCCIFLFKSFNQFCYYHVMSEFFGGPLLTLDANMESYLYVCFSFPFPTFFPIDF